MEYLLYTSMRDYIYARIEFLTEHILSKNLSLALALVLGLLTIWIMVQGFMIATGRSQEGLKGFIFNLGKTYIIVLMALGVASTSSFSLRTLTDTLADSVSQVMRGDSAAGSECLTKNNGSLLGCKVDRNLSLTQAIMAKMNAVDTAEDQSLIDKINIAKTFAGAGAAGPGVVAGTMLIVFRIAMALFIGFGPIFILCLIFKKTAPLFQKWLYYGFATIFSGVMLAVMADIAMDLVSNIGGALFISQEAVYFFTGENVTGIMDAATQQLGLGIILSTLLITVPPMAGMFFNGVMGSASGFNAFVGWNRNGVSGNVPPNIDGGRSFQTVNNQNTQSVDKIIGTDPRATSVFDNSSRRSGQSPRGIVVGQAKATNQQVPRQPEDKGDHK